MLLTRRQAVAGLASSLIASPAVAQPAWPTRALRFVSGGQAGSISDVWVRTVEKKITERLGQSLYIENISGAGGMSAASVVNKATDGHTFLVSTTAINGIGVTLYKKPTFDWKTELPPVALMTTSYNAAAVRADSGFNTLSDLIDYVRRNPDKATYGSAGVGSTGHLSGVLFGQRIGAPLIHVPYRGSGPSLTGLVRGDTLFSINNVSLFGPMVQEKTLKFLAVTANSRLPKLPDIPTMQEEGLKDFVVSVWFGISAATGTPRDVIQRMGDVIVEAIRSPDVSDKIRSLDAEPTPMGPDEYRGFIESEVKLWAPIVAASGATVE